jgi:periplasmic divalent cation tolerance protein
VYFFDMQNKYLMVINTCPDAASAESMASMLVEKGLAACINILPNIRSVYVWQGERVIGEEYLLLIKTLASCYSELETTIRSRHPYELPEIIAVPIEAGLPEYLTWIADIRNEQ